MTDACVGDLVEYVQLDGDLAELIVEHIETGTAHGRLYVGAGESVWDWQVTRVLRKTGE